jgi:hypothetical protein
MAKSKKEEEPVEEFAMGFEEQSEEAKTVGEALEKQNMAYGSPEWQEFILSELTEEEQMDGYPRCFGLRRLAQKYLGDFEFAGPVNYDVHPTDQSRVVTVLYELRIYWKLGFNVDYGNLDIQFPVRIFRGLADCVESSRNKYAMHPAASAETKAESRALKKALGLNITSAEEMVSGYSEDVFKPSAPSDIKPISDKIKTMINTKLKVVGVELKDALRDFKGPADLNTFSIDQGHDFFKFIQKYQQVES